MRLLNRRCVAACTVASVVLVTLIAGEPLPTTGGPRNVTSVVINEIFYNAAGDDDGLEWLELHNHSRAAVDVGGWKLLDGITGTLPAGTVLPAAGYLVLCSDRRAFEEAYGLEPDGTFKKSLSNSGERIQLADRAGRRVDSVEYADGPPWPMSPDGYSASLERIRPDRPGELVSNWDASLLSDDVTQPGGTPGRRNSAYADSLPPIISSVSYVPRHPRPGQTLEVGVEIDPMGDGVREISLLYRTARPGSQGEEVTLPMQRTGGDYIATIPGQAEGALIRFHIRATNTQGSTRTYPSANDIRPALSAYVSASPPAHTIALASIIHVGQEEYAAAQNAPVQGGFGPPGFGGFRPSFGSQKSQDSLPPQGRCAFVYRAPGAKEFELFDFVNITPRKAGYKVRFRKDRPLREVTTLNIINEGSVGFAVAELAAYELYRRVGNPAPESEIVRLTVDGKALGYHLAFEQPNKGFLRRNGIDDNGNLYKIQWMGRNLVEQHEKKTNTESGHEDLIALVDALESTQGDQQWAVIEEHFNVPEVVNYFAVNMVLSHWDGFFNNFFAYHDTEDTGRWEMYPWDQDQTHGYYRGLPSGEVFSDMPLTFGMEGDEPPNRNGADRFEPPFGMPGGPPGFGRGTMWWRAGGHFSRPLLANPVFRERFLRRVKVILEEVYTEEEFYPYLDDLRERLFPEALIQAETFGHEPRQDIQDVEQSILDLKKHLTQRGQFLLDQDELRALNDSSP
jgi:hypothetical protein